MAPARHTRAIKEGGGQPTHLSPARRPSAFGMLYEQMGSSNLAVFGPAAGRNAAAVVLGHVDFELLDIGAERGLPAGVLFGGVEVVRQLLAVAMAHLPSGGQACL